MIRLYRLPQRALYNRRIPKNKFYKHLAADTKLKNLFIEQVENIIWKYKLAKETINIDPTPEIQEIQIFEIHLKQKTLSLEILESIDRAIPYPILYVLLYQDEGKLIIAYKQRNKTNEDRCVVKSYYESSWQPVSEIVIDLPSGLNLNAVYEGYVRRLLPVQADKDETLEVTVERHMEIERLKREISRLEKKIRSEKQFNRKVEYNLELQQKRRELSQLVNKYEEDGHGEVEDAIF